MLKKLLGYFLQGILYLVPIAATIYVVIKAVILIDGLIPVEIPGLGLLIILAIFTAALLGKRNDLLKLYL